MRLIYDNTVDQGAWRLSVADDVEGSDGYRGTLRVFKMEGCIATLVHTEQVGVMYAARFGPDMDDVAEWQKIAINVIDNPEARQT